MKPHVRDFIDTLVMEMEATASTAFVDGLLSAAKTKITAGLGEVGMISQGTINGKSFTRFLDGSLTAIEMMGACRRALDLYQDNDAPPITTPDFSRIQI
jgi:hypothetical protein